MADWLTALPPATGVLVCHDGAAGALVRAAARCGRRVPEDLAVLGVDNDQMICEMGPVPISSVVTASEKIGFEAATLLHRLLNNCTLPVHLPAGSPVCVRPLGIATRRSSDVLAVEDPHVAAAMRYIRDHLRERFGVDDVVATLPVSRRYLEYQFRRTLGRSPGEEIRRQRMDHACELLRTTDLSIGDVGRACGFRDIALFSHGFRQSMDTTPTAYRQACRFSAPGWRRQ
jgi:LacI family transcriptional regulator